MVTSTEATQDYLVPGRCDCLRSRLSLSTASFCPFRLHIRCAVHPIDKCRVCRMLHIGMRYGVPASLDRGNHGIAQLDLLLLCMMHATRRYMSAKTALGLPIEQTLRQCALFCLMALFDKECGGNGDRIFVGRRNAVQLRASLRQRKNL